MLSHIWGIFSSFVPPLKAQPRGPNSSLEAQIPVLRPKSQPQGPNPSLKAQILAWRLGPCPLSWDLDLEVEIYLQGWNLGLEARIWASRLGFGLQGGGGGEISLVKA